MAARHVARRRAQASAENHGRLHRRDEAAIDILRIPPLRLIVAGPRACVDEHPAHLGHGFLNLRGRGVELREREPHVAGGLDDDRVIVSAHDLRRNPVILAQLPRRRREREHLRARRREQRLSPVLVPHDLPRRRVDDLAAEVTQSLVIARKLGEAACDVAQGGIGRLGGLERIHRRRRLIGLAVIQVPVGALDRHTGRRCRRHGHSRDAGCGPPPHTLCTHCLNPSGYDVSSKR